MKGSAQLEVARVLMCEFPTFALSHFGFRCVANVSPPFRERHSHSHRYGSSGDHPPAKCISGRHPTIPRFGAVQPEGSSNRYGSPRYGTQDWRWVGPVAIARMGPNYSPPPPGLFFWRRRARTQPALLSLRFPRQTRARREATNWLIQLAFPSLESMCCAVCTSAQTLFAPSSHPIGACLCVAGMGKAPIARIIDTGIIPSIPRAGPR
jgi:hypothetical protein